MIAGVEQKAARPGRRPPAQRRRVCAGVSGRDDGGVLRRAPRRVRLLRRRCRGAASTTTRRWRWRGSSGTARASGRRSSASSSRTICSTLSASDARARAHDKGKVEGLVGYARRRLLRAGPPVRQLGRVERLPRAASAMSVAGAGDAGTPRRSGSGSRATARRGWPLPPSPVRRQATSARQRARRCRMVRDRRNDYSVQDRLIGHRAVT